MVADHVQIELNINYTNINTAKIAESDPVVVIKFAWLFEIETHGRVSFEISSGLEKTSCLQCQNISSQFSSRI